MDVISIVSTFATLIGFSMQLYGSCKDYVDAVRGDCPAALRLILVESSSLAGTLKAVKDLLELSDTPKEDAERLERQIGPALKECYECIKILNGLLPEPLKKDGKLTKTERAKIVFKALKWSSNKEKCEAQLKKLKTHKATLNLGLTTELSHDVKKMGADVAEVKSTVNTMQAKLDDAQRSRVLRWLEKVDPSKNHNRAAETRHDNTGEWLTGGEEWKRWINGGPDPKSQFLWIYGIPGAGKTFLACSMIKKVAAHVKDHGKIQGSAYAYYYCYHGRKSDEKDEAVNMLRSVISQLCAASRSIPVILNEAFNSGHEPTVSDLLDCLEAALAHFATAYVVVDAVDESDPRPKLIEVLSRLASDKRFARLRLAATSRDYLEIRKAFEPRSIAISMANAKVTDDIAKYVKGRLKGDKYQDWPQKLRDDVAARLPVMAQGMFRYAACQLDILADCGGAKEVEKRCASLPKTLDETYERILKSIADSHKGDVIRALGIVIGSLGNSGQISVHTLVGGVKAHMDGDSFFNIDTLRRQCVSLIKVDPDETVSLAHYTVREFLQSGRIEQKVPDFYLPQDKADEIFGNTVMLAASQYKHKDDSDLRDVREYRNGDPVDLAVYGLRQTRTAMFWDKGSLAKPKDKKNRKGEKVEERLTMKIGGKQELVLKTRSKELVRDLLNPYGPAFRGLQLLGGGFHHKDTGNDQMFEWLVSFNKKADNMEKAAAHLTMLLSFEDHPELAQAFLSKVENKAALFKKEMEVRLPPKYEEYRGHGRLDSQPTGVTVLGFYKKGLERGYETGKKLEALRKHFGAYLPAQTAPAPTNSKTNSSPQGTHPSASKTSAESSGGRGSGGGNGQPSHGKPNPTSNTSSQKKPQIQGHAQSQAHGQTGHGQGKPQVQTQTGQGQGRPQSQTQTPHGQSKPQAQSQTGQGQGKPTGHAQSGQGQGKPVQNTGGSTPNNSAPNNSTPNNSTPNRTPQATQGGGSSSKD